MTDLTRLNPFKGLTRVEPLPRDMDDLFQGFFMKPFSWPQMSRHPFPIDVTENDGAYTVWAEIPGFRKEDIQVSVHGDQVVISAEAKQEKAEKEGDLVVLRECSYGRQYRSFTLPQTVDDTKTTARYEDGILKLTLPKKADGALKKITVQ
ncbi:hypothetical protein A9404_05700 [Halothiobacillus diazotrophicus]|uniref:SHSP domain-containing protein n=1 Tax=Halothiobacillus diazotrophicus TaxID=1860122 RepID=A0A191ZGE5_9GAMM|nr:Hsp20/alpha crystallin family protein [Halothiobacillus diazotrophicus]ANJ66938.1 hypothetical protein A9404_05700 [Halothiobacillus diazotrophicus]